VKAAFASTQWQSQGATITSEESSLTPGFLITTITLETSQAAVDALYSDFAHTWTNGSWPWELAKLVPCTATVGIARSQLLNSPGSVNNTLVSCTGGGVGGARAEPALCPSSGLCKPSLPVQSPSPSPSPPAQRAVLTISFQFLASVVPTLLPALEDGVKAAFASTQWQSQGATITSEESSLTPGFLITTITLETSQAAVDALYSDFAHTWTNGSWPWELAKLVPCTATVGIARSQLLNSPGSVNNTLVSCTGGGVGGARAEPALCPSSGLCQSLPIVPPVLESLFFLAVQWNASYASTLLPFLTRATSILAIGTGQQARVLDITSVESPITRGFIFTTVTVQASQAAVDALYKAVVSPWSAGSKAANLITNGGIPCASQMMVRATQGSSFRNTILSCSGGGTQATPGLCSGSGVCGQRAVQ